MSNDKKPIVWVTGDVILAWDLVHKTGNANPNSAYDPADASLEVYRQAGGAWFTRKLLEAMNKKEKWGWEILGVGPKKGIQLKQLDQLAHAYAIWTEYPAMRDSSERKTVRVRSYFGTQKRSDKQPDEKWFSKPQPDQIKEGRVKLVVATDDGIEDKYAKKRPDLVSALLDSTNTERLPWIVTKDRTAHQDLIRTLSGDNKEERDLTCENVNAFYKHAIAIVPLDVLRRENHRIGYGLSWESLVNESLNAVTKHPKLKRFRWVIVSFTNAGALILSQPSSENGSTTESKAWLVLDPAEVEDSWRRPYPGQIVGSTTCLVAAVAKAIVNHLRQPITSPPTKELLQEAVIDGLLRMRALHYIGYLTKDRPVPIGDTHDKHNPTTYCVLNSFQKLHKDRPDLEKATGEPSMFIEVEVDIPPPDKWTILEKKLSSQKENTIINAIFEKGPEKGLATTPRAEYGNLVTTDPKEIDDLQAIDTLLRNYVDKPGDKPISIAVFGQPGSGKSFVVTQIAKQLGEKIGDKPLTFNLSQFSDPDMLIGAFHQIRDEGLKGKIPLVFWDEFDTALDGKVKGWLRYFLAPMQDGQFQEGQVTHPIGRAIFVFAGGTCERMEDFYPELKKQVSKDDNTNNGTTPQGETEENEKTKKKKKKTEEEKEKEKEKKLKVPDFVSRLRGYLDVPGLNPRKENPKSGPESQKVDRGKSEIGAHLIVRRALILHQHLKKFDGLIKLEDKDKAENKVKTETKDKVEGKDKAEAKDKVESKDKNKNKEINISTGVLKAFLEIPEYKHGARSMEAIVRMSALRNVRKFTASCLPSEEQLNLHVDGKKFLELAGDKDRASGDDNAS